MDGQPADPPFRLLTTFTAQQLVLLAACPVAWFIAGCVSRARLIAVSQTPRYVLQRAHSARARGRTVSEDLPSTPFVSGSAPSGGGEKVGGDFIVFGSPLEEVGPGILLCGLLASIDAALVYVVSDGWGIALACLFFGTLSTVRRSPVPLQLAEHRPHQVADAAAGSPRPSQGVLVGDGLLWDLVGPRRTYARKADGCECSNCEPPVARCTGLTPATLLPALVAGCAHDATTPHWTTRLACGLAAFAIFPSLAITPKVFWILVPFGITPLHEERLGSTNRLRTKALVLSAVHLVTFAWLCWVNRPVMTSADEPAGRGVLYIERPPDASPVLWVCLPDIIFLFGSLFFVQLASALYRFDHQPSPEQPEPLQPETLALSASPPGEGRRVAVPPTLLVLQDRVRAHLAAPARWGYFPLAAVQALVWLAALPVLGNLLFVRAQALARRFGCWPRSLTRALAPPRSPSSPSWP